MLKTKISADYIQAFKNKDAISKSLLSTIKGEIQTIEKNLVVENLSDEEVSKILNKFAKNLKENINILCGKELESDKSLAANFLKTKEELKIVESYLPKEMGREEVISKIDELIASGANNMGLIMKGFVGLQVDKKLVSELVKTKLA